MKKYLANVLAASVSVAVLATATLFGVSAHAQDSRLSLADRVSRLEQQAQQSQGNVGVVNQVNDLQQQIAQLQGQIEVLQHQLQTVQDTNKSQYVDLDTRLGRLEGNGKGNAPANASNGPANAATTPSAPIVAPTVAGGDDDAPAANAGNKGAPAPADSPATQAAYDAAFKQLRAGDYTNASHGFRDFLTKYPDSPLAPNAYYWLGESYYVTTNYPVAMEAFKRLIARWPQSDKAPDALLKLGYCQYQLKQQNDAVATLKSVSIKYPGSKAAGLAAERLRRIQQAAN
jgi:tol-pal system protein YbgF